MATTIDFYDILPAPGSCPFAHRAWLALEEKKLDYKHHLVDKANKSRQFLDLFASIVGDTRDTATVPVIIDGGDKVAESLIVIEYLDAKHPDSGTKLYPDDPVGSAKVRLFIELFTKKFTGSFFKLMGTAKDSPDFQGLVDTFEANLVALDKFVADSGGKDGSFLLGSTYSAAETATTPFLRRGLLGLKALRDVDVDKIVEGKSLKRLGAWIKASLDRPSNKHTGPTDEQLIESFKQRFAA